MSRQVIYVGQVPNDGTGDSLRTAGQKVNQNFEEVYTALDSFSYTLPAATTSILGGVKVDGSTIIVNSQGVISATSTVPANITGNAGTVTNGVYLNGSYADPNWITSLSYSKLIGAPSLYTLPPATTSILGGVIVDGTSITINNTTSVIQANAGALVGSSLATSITSIGANTGTTTINNSLTVTGNLDVKGSTTFVESTVLQVADKNIELAVTTSPTDVLADSGGIIVKGTTNKTLQWAYASSSWTSSENFDLSNGKTYKIGGTDVLSSSSLGSGITSSSLTSVGVLGTLVVGTGGLAVNSSSGISTTQTTFPLLTTTATTINFASAATALTIGASTGTTTINSPTITYPNVTNVNYNGASPTLATTSTGTVSLFNNNALTANLFGDATSINIGSSTGTLTVANPTVTFSNATSFNINGSNPTLNTSSTGTLTLFGNPKTVTAFAGATTTTIGSTSGLTNIANSLVATGATNVSLSAVIITGTAGQFQCNASILKVGDTVTVAGTLVGTATITGYSNPTTYYIITTDGSTTFTLSAIAGGSAISTTAGTTTGLTFTLNRGAIVIDSSNGITTTQTSINLLNTTATTINAFGAATSLSIGASSGSTTINNTLTLAKYFTASNVALNYTSTASAGTTTTLTSTSNYFQAITGSSNQNIRLPDATTLVTGFAFKIFNNSTGTLTIQYNDATTLNTVSAGGSRLLVCSSTSTTNGVWEVHGFLPNSGAFGTSLIDSSTATFSAFTTPTTFTLGYNSTAASITYISTGAVAASTTKRIDIGESGVANSITNINIGSSVSGALGTTTINSPTVTLANATALNINGASPGIVTSSTGTASVFNTNALVGNLFGAATTMAIGNTATAAQTVNMFTASTGASTYNFATGATVNGTTKTINIGTNGVSGSTTNIVIGSSAGTSSTTIYGFTVGSNIVTSSSSFDLINTTATTLNIGGAATTLTLGNTATAAQTVNMFTASTGASTYNFATGATLNATTKTINIGTAGVSGSVTNISIGSTVSGATGTTTIGGVTTTLTGTTLNINGASPSIVTSDTGTASVFNTNALIGSLFGAATTINIGNTATAAQTVNMFTANTGASTYNFATGATLTATTKAINIGTNGVSGSTTNITIGGSAGTSTTTINGTIKATNAIATTAAAPTIVSAATIAPTAYITFISGTTSITTITAPASMTSSGGQIVLIPTGLWSTATSGNIALASTAVVNKALIMYYDSATAKWYPSY
jgi:hypothetical protein